MLNKNTTKSLIKLAIVTVILLTVSIVIFAETVYWPSGVAATSEVQGVTFSSVDLNGRIKSWNASINGTNLSLDNIKSRSWYQVNPAATWQCHDEDSAKCVVSTSYCTGPGRDIFVDVAPYFPLGDDYITTKHKYEELNLSPQVFYTSQTGFDSLPDRFKGFGAINTTPCP